MKNDFYIGMYEDTYLAHTGGRIKGWIKQGHLYLSRFFKNGKWNYVYPKNGGSSSSKTSTVQTVGGGGSPQLKAYQKPKVNTKTKNKTSSTQAVASVVQKETSSEKKSSKGSSSSSSSSKKSTGIKAKGGSSGSSSKAKQEKQAAAKGSSASKAEKQEKKAAKVVNGKEVKDFSLHNSTEDMIKAIKNYEDGTNGYILVDGKPYIWKKVNGVITFYDHSDGATKLNYDTVLKEIQELVDKNKKQVQVGKHKK